MNEPKHFLLVEDDIELARAVSAVLGQLRPTKTATTVGAALRLLTSETSWSGLVVDIGLPDGSGLEVAESARARFPALPILVLTGFIAGENINHAHTLGAEFVAKPGSERHVRDFMSRAIALERLGDERLVKATAALARRCSLTPREVDLVAAATAAGNRPDLLKDLGVSQNTFKTQLRVLLAKTGHHKLHTLTGELLRSALDGAETSASQRRRQLG
jgi:two-component system, OmpR family, response regulator QseB